MIEILYRNKDIVIIKKAPGVPTQSDLSGDDDAMLLTASGLLELGESKALWLVHRLDRVVGGLVVFARSKSAAATLSMLVGGRGMEKEYLAVVEGNAEGGIMQDYIYKDSARGKAFIVDKPRRGAKEAVLEYSPISVVDTERGALTLVRIKLHTGRFHQIRVQFSSRKMPLVGDGKYGSHDNRVKYPALYASHLAFSSGGISADVRSVPDINEYPWSLFDKECYK